MKFFLVLGILAAITVYFVYKSMHSGTGVIAAATGNVQIKDKLPLGEKETDQKSLHVDYIAARHQFSTRQVSDALAVIQPLFQKQRVKQDVGKKTQEVQEDDSGITFSSDQLTNTLFARLPKERVGEFEEYCRTLDQSADQICVHLIIANATLEKGESFGVDWLISHVPAGTVPPDLLESLQSLAGSFTATFQIASASRFFNAIVHASETNTRFKVVSTPSGTTLSGKEVEFTSGTQIPYTQQSSESTVTQDGQVVSQVAFKDVLLSVKITPVVTDTGIYMDIDQRNDSVSDNVKINGNSVPIISTQTLKTSCKLADGQAVLLLNNDTDQKRSERDGLIGVDKIPVLRTLFGVTDRSKERQQLVLILWPEIVHGGKPPVVVHDLTDSPEDPLLEGPGALNVDQHAPPPAAAGGGGVR